jgi:hypothetical protein
MGVGQFVGAYDAENPAILTLYLRTNTLSQQSLVFQQFQVGLQGMQVTDVIAIISSVQI